MDNEFMKAYQKAKELNINSTIESVSESPNELDQHPVVNAPDAVAPAEGLPENISFLKQPADDRTNPMTAKAEDEKKPKSSKGSKKPIVIVLAILLLALIGGIIYSLMTMPGGINLGFAIGGTEEATSSAQPPVLGRNQDLADQYVSEIASLMVLPDEKPLSVAQVTDLQKIDQSQQFFRNAKNGDVIVIFSTKAILYDPVKKVIIDVSNVNLTGPQDQQSSPSANTQ